VEDSARWAAARRADGRDSLAGGPISARTSPDSVVEWIAYGAGTKEIDFGEVGPESLASAANQLRSRGG